MTTPPPHPEPEKGDVVEKRLKPTLIRRRAKPTEALPTGAPTTAEAPAAQVQAEAPKETKPTLKAGFVSGARQPSISENLAMAAAAKAAALVEEGKPKVAKPGMKAPLSKAAEDAAAKERDLKKAARKKKSKDEWLMDDIKKAGGLLQFAESIVVGEDEPVVPEVVAPVAPERVERVFEPSASRRKKSSRRETRRAPVLPTSLVKRAIRIDQSITLSDLSQAMGVKGGELIKKLMGLGVMKTINQAVDADAAILLASEYGFEVERVGIQEDKLLAKPKQVVGEDAVHRPPVVTVMGHVDHGKTSILDAIRKADVAGGESGGITQHIGAYDVHHGKGTITFLDTPGHEAFTAMRARGAKITDIVILVVAADDGVMPQTKEAIDHAKAAGVPIIVAINKIDKPEANPDRVKRELAENGVVLEEWGGDTLAVATSAKTKVGIDQLLETILLQSEVLELKANPKGPADGTIVEARLDKGRGPVATLLVQGGTIRIGDSIVCGVHSGRVRTLTNSHGQPVKEAGPSLPVEVVGLDGVPLAGDVLHVTTDDKVAKLISENRAQARRDADLSADTRVSLEDLHRQMMEGTLMNLNLILKADVYGSVEVLNEAIGKITSEKVTVTVLHRGVGGITESDVTLAMASNAVIVGFHVVPDGKSRKLAEQNKIEIKTYSVIYNLVDDIRNAMEGLLAPTRTEKVIGQVEVRQVFAVSKVGTIAGSMVTSGKITRSSKVRLTRDGVIIYTGDVASLKRFKDDAKEVQEGYECGVGIAGYNDLKPGDVIEAFIIEETATKL